MSQSKNNAVNTAKEPEIIEKPQATKKAEEPLKTVYTLYSINERNKPGLDGDIVGNYPAYRTVDIFKIKTSDDEQDIWGKTAKGWIALQLNGNLHVK